MTAGWPGEGAGWRAGARRRWLGSGGGSAGQAPRRQGPAEESNFHERERRQVGSGSRSANAEGRGREARARGARVGRTGHGEKFL
ncbi:hypothetical protein GQ55_4G083700 [Panicum hallii var. hallii]|uniref:Uncharacterized protein n=1 Tax=Panicum hallii var. hallii TaxID=1504633 RepID=A0A2T7DWJ2_9POAL|nr:hypothetical protein GQ55_4G083700 [Panicum hallii var. hallii]